MIKKHKKATIIIICLFLLLILFFPYIKAEVLTLKYGDEFDGLQKQTNMLGELEYLKVLSYSSDTADAGRSNKMGHRADWKKAIVTLAEGTIEII